MLQHPLTTGDRHLAQRVALRARRGGVVAVPNTAPTVTVPVLEGAIYSDGTLLLLDGNANAIHVADAEDDELTLTLSVDGGTLALLGSVDLEVSGNGTATVVAVGTVAALNESLGSNGVQWTPAGATGNFTLTAHVSDGELFDEDTIDLEAIEPANRAPVIEFGAPCTLDPISEFDTENAGNTVAEILASGGPGAFTDADGDTLGIAVIDQDTSASGEWQYDVGGGFQPIVGVMPSNALLLDQDASIRFVPSGAGIGMNLLFRLWDQSDEGVGSGEIADTTTNGDDTPYSTAVEVATIQVESES